VNFRETILKTSDDKYYGIGTPNYKKANQKHDHFYDMAVVRIVNLKVQGCKFTRLLKLSIYRNSNWVFLKQVSCS
jgi:hypothetical protein